MQKRLLLASGQRGSILAGVIVLSIIMSVSAGAFLIVVGIFSSQRSRMSELTRIKYAAESGALMGQRWLRGRDSALTWGYTGSTPVEISPGGFLDMDTARVKVTFEYRSNPSPTRVIVSRATLPQGSDTVVLTWTIERIDSVNSGSAYMTMGNWVDSIAPYTF